MRTKVLPWDIIKKSLFKLVVKGDHVCCRLYGSESFRYCNKLKKIVMKKKYNVV